MANIPIMKISNCVANNSLTNDAIQKYSELYKKYISEDFSTMCIVFINRLISESTTLPLTIKNSYNVHKTILKIVKELMMNEYEITLFSLLLDQIGWSSTNFIFEDNLFYLAQMRKRLQTLIQPSPVGEGGSRRLTDEVFTSRLPEYFAKTPT